MSVNVVLEESNLIDAAIAEVRMRLPETWVVEPSKSNFEAGDGDPRRPDAVIDVRAPNGTITSIVVEAKGVCAARRSSGCLGRVDATLWTLTYNVPVLVVAPWISPRTQDLSAAEGLNYVDMTGNVLLRLENPAAYVKSTVSK